jgi:hypothetical protein
MAAVGTAAAEGMAVAVDILEVGIPEVGILEGDILVVAGSPAAEDIPAEDKAAGGRVVGGRVVGEGTAEGVGNRAVMRMGHEGKVVGVDRRELCMVVAGQKWRGSQSRWEAGLSTAVSEMR